MLVVPYLRIAVLAFGGGLVVLPAFSVNAAARPAPGSAPLTVAGQRAVMESGLVDAVERGASPDAPPGGSSSPGRPTQRLLLGIHDPVLRQLVEEVLERNPAIASASAQASAALQRAPQVEALPDPVLGVMAFPASPQTRVGPQRFTATLSQQLPWFGKRSLRGQAERQHASALEARVEAQRLELLTETRRLYLEIAFLDAYEEVVLTDKATLEQYEALARARYASGVGLDQVVIKIQAEITQDDARLLDIASRRGSLVAALNALRDRPQTLELARLTSPRPSEAPLDIQTLRSRALEEHPELSRADAEIERAETGIEQARKGFRPDLMLALTYTNVGPRDDPAGRTLPDNGHDVFGVSASINLPIQRKRLRAGVEEAAERRLAAVEQRRAVEASIDRSLGDLVQRASLTWRRLRLLEDVLSIQAEESLRSAEAAYSAGTLGGLDLLDAERVVLEVRTSLERARADYALALAQLEGAIGGPLPDSGIRGDAR